jgi:hypothetical protein
MKFATALLSAGLMAGAAVADSEKSHGKSCGKPIVNPSAAFGWERLDKNNVRQIRAFAASG